MDREQHIVQDSAEHYAVAVMQREAERLGIASTKTSADHWEAFEAYLADRGLTSSDFTDGLYATYKRNVDLQVPTFVDRLAHHFAGDTLDFELDEAPMRLRGLKADFLIHVGALPDPIAVSLKNYVGAGGITRPQVSSGTFASFAAGFIFDRIGVGQYADPRIKDDDGTVTGTFFGQNVATRDAVLDHIGRADLRNHLAVLDRLQAEVRKEFLGDDCEFYDQARVRAAAQRVAKEGIAAVLGIFELLGLDQVRERFLARIGLDGKEESLFFDSEQYVDSITSSAYHEWRQRINAPDTTFTVARHLQNIRFAFIRADGPLLKADVPFTINTNGAWYRPKIKYTGLQPYNDKGHIVKLRWGQRRPRKSREIATSTNSYLDLRSVGIFGA